RSGGAGGGGVHRLRHVLPDSGCTVQRAAGRAGWTVGIHSGGRTAGGGHHHHPGGGAEHRTLPFGDHLPGGVPRNSGLHHFPSPDGTGRGDSSAAGSVRRLCRSGSGRGGGHFPFGPDSGHGSGNLPAAVSGANRRATGRSTGMMRLLAWLLLAPAAMAHVVSMSSGQADIAGTRLHYELRMPLYEVPHVKSPESTLFGHIRFSSGGQAARLTSSHCAADSTHDLYVCIADYEFPAPVERLDVDCTFHAVISPTHVHVLRAQIATPSGTRQDQAVFDQAFERATLRF